MSERNDLIGGHFRIRGEALESVYALAQQWKSSPDGARFQHLAVRRCGLHQDSPELPEVEIDFLFRLDGVNPEREHRQFFHKYTDMMYRRFGAGLVRWSVANPVYLVE